MPTDAKGTLSHWVLPSLLKDLYVGRRTGLLSFTKGDERRSLRFHQGRIISADTNVKDDRIGDRLVRAGLLRDVDLRRVSSLMLREKKPLGDILQEHGLIERPRLEEAVTEQVRELFAKVVSWKEGSYLFHDEAPPAREDTLLNLPTGELILEAVRNVSDPVVVRYCLGDVDRVLILSSDPLLRFQKLSLSPADGFLLSRIDGTLSARETLGMLPFPGDEAHRSLMGLMCTGVLEYRPGPAKVASALPEIPMRAEERGRAHGLIPPSPPAPSPPRAAPPARPPEPPPVLKRPLTELEQRREEITETHAALQRGDYAKAFGLRANAGEDEVKDAYFKLVKRFHPDEGRATGLTDLKDQIEGVFLGLGAAYAALSGSRTGVAEHVDPEVITDAEATLDIDIVEESIRTAEEQLAQDRPADATQLLESVLPMTEGDLRLRARLLLVETYLKDPRWLKRGEEQLQKVVEENPQHTDAHFKLGAIYKACGFTSRAEAMFRRVLELDASHEAAQAELAPVAAPSAPSPRGFFKRLFGKT